MAKLYAADGGGSGGGGGSCLEAGIIDVGWLPGRVARGAKGLGVTGEAETNAIVDCYPF